MFCPNCGNQYQGTPRFCENCGLRFNVVQAAETRSLQGAGWFRRHLNWTLVIGLAVITVASFMVSYLAYYYMIEEAAGFVTFVTVVFNIILTAIVGGWVLNQKGRSLLWLLLIPFWIGWVVWLALDNRRQFAPSRLNVPGAIPPAPITKAFSREPVATGLEAEHKKYCPNCGVRLPQEAKFCFECGANLLHYAAK